MNQNNAPSIGTVLLTFAAGAAVGAVVVALTTPKTGPGLRRELRDLARCGKDRAEAASGQDREPTTPAEARVGNGIGDQRRAWKVSVNDLPG
jgi:gas vesicle protein